MYDGWLLVSIFCECACCIFYDISSIAFHPISIVIVHVVLYFGFSGFTSPRNCPAQLSSPPPLSLCASRCQVDCIAQQICHVWRLMFQINNTNVHVWPQQDDLAGQTRCQSATCWNKPVSSVRVSFFLLIDFILINFPFLVLFSFGLFSRIN